MPDEPFIPVVIAEQFGTGHEEDPPALEPEFCLIAVGILQDRHDLFPPRVLQREPVLAGLLVVAAVDPPVILHQQVVVEVEQQVIGGHDPAGEEIAPHPVVLALGLEEIGQLAVAEDVDEQPAFRFQPAGDPPQQFGIVAHMLEHLHRDDPVEGIVDGEIVHVGGDDPHIGEALFTADRFYVLSLRGRVGYSRDAGMRVLLGHPERQRPPAAAQLENIHAVHQAGPAAGLRQHGLFGGGNAGHADRVQAAAVFAARPQHQGKEGGGQFVVLVICGIGLDRQGAASAAGQKIALPLTFDLRVTVILIPQPPLQQSPDSPPDDHIRQQARLPSGRSLHSWLPLRQR